MMDSERWPHLDEIFHRADAVPTEERDAYLVVACADDETLLAELRALFAADPQLDQKLDALMRAELKELETATTLPHAGPWRLLEEIGRGGLATVFLAERADAEFEKKVAVKLIRRGFDSLDILERLRRERQILANLEHPTIARLLDGGSTEDGRPYVVMEFIEGERIDHFCASRGLGLGERIQLFVQLCEAVHFAHRNLILHCDLKPSNVLVTPGGGVKLLDFGIAKILAAEGESSEPTITRERLLTPQWASPEQLLGKPLSTASDVYALGLLLYLLLTGRRAYEVDPERSAEAERRICLEDPAPSGLDLDLDTILKVALRKEPERRYASAEQLADDLRAFLAHRPISARRDRLGYRVGKFARRHMLAVAAAMLVFSSLTAGIVLTTWQARRAQANLRVAEAERRQSDAIAGFLIDLFEISDPGTARGRQLTARDVLDLGARKIQSRLDQDLPQKATLLATLGRVYKNLAFYDEAEALLDQALALRLELLGPEDPLVAVSRRDLAMLAYDRGDYAGAREALSQALSVQERSQLDGQELATSRQLLGDIEVALGRLDTAEASFRRAFELRRAGTDPAALSETRNSLAELAYQRGDLERAEQEFGAVLAERRQIFGSVHPDVAVSLNNLAVVLQAQGRIAEAKPLLDEALDLRRKLFGSNHGDVAQALHNLAMVERALGELEAARLSWLEALEINRRVLGAEHPATAAALEDLADLYRLMDRGPEAEAALLEALAARRKTFGENHLAVARTLTALADLYRLKSGPRAEATYREALAMFDRLLPSTDLRRAPTLIGLGRELFRSGRPEEAERWLREAHELRVRGLPAGHWQKAAVAALRAEVLLALGRGREALVLLEENLPILDRVLGSDDSRTVDARRDLERARAAVLEHQP